MELFSQLSVLQNNSFNVAKNHGVRRLMKTLNPVLNGGNSRVYYISISHCKTGEFNCDCDFEGSKGYLLFHHCHREIPEGIKLPLQDTLEFY